MTDDNDNGTEPEEMTLQELTLQVRELSHFQNQIRAWFQIQGVAIDDYRAHDHDQDNQD